MAVDMSHNVPTFPPSELEKAEMEHYDEKPIEGGAEATIMDQKAEKKLRWKIDLIILPALSSIYFFASIGRADLGNAKTAGLTKDLNLTATQYSNLASIFFVGYIIFQIPGTLLLRQIGPAIQFGTAMILWGLFTAVSITAKSYGPMMAYRVMVGVCEAFSQGATFYLSFWYTYQELATRGGIFFGTSTIAGAFNGLIAYGIQENLTGKNNWDAWQWLFLIEGILPIFFGFVVMFFLPSVPEKARGFSEAERALATKRSRRSHNPENAKLRVNSLYRPFLSLKFWLFCVISSGGHFCLSSLSNFLPAIIQSFGYTAVRAQLMTVIVYACAFVSIILFSQMADRMNRRSIPLIICSCFTIVGYVVILSVTNYKAQLAATCLLSIGIFPPIVLQLVWLQTCVAGYTNRAMSIAMINVIAQAVSIGAQQAYNTPPYYRKGHASALGISVLQLLVTIILVFYLRLRNKQKRARQFTSEVAADRDVDFDIIGDKHPDFFYGY